MKISRGVSDMGFPIFADTDADFAFYYRSADIGCRYYILYYTRVMKMRFGHR